MDKQQLQHKLNQPYNSENWKEVVKFVFPNVSIFSSPKEIPVKETDRDEVELFLQIGTVQLKDGKILDLFELHLKDKVNLLKNRVRLNDIVSSTVDMDRSHGVLSVFEKGTEDFRFTFSAKASEFNEEEGDFVIDRTDTKRFTYLLGKNESCKTPAERFYALSEQKQKADIKAVEDAFSVEKLSKRFFEDYKKQYESFVSYLIKTPGYYTAIFNNDDKKIRDFVKILLGRIVFIKFVQKKGWMGVPSNEKGWDNGDYRFLENAFKNFEHKDNFYSEFLNSLFFEALDKGDRPNNIFELTGTKVPFLSGGLFDNHDPKTRAINFPKEYFESLFDFLDRYNFTIDENDVNDHEIGIDPEMLGHIFENLLEDNKDKGAFYTPKEIVRYMCRESLKEYLKTSLIKQNVWPQNEEKSKQLEEGLDAFVNKREAGGIIDFEGPIALALKNVKICDPAIGSGAFPMGLLQEIFHLVHLLYSASFDKVGDIWEIDSWKPNVVKQNIIQNSIYGVDIEKGAVDIARLRFWLSLIVDEPEPTALPHLDYKIVVGNSLLSKFEDTIIDIDWELEDPNPGLFGSKLTEERAAILKEISEKQQQVFEPDSDDEKLSQEIRDLKIDLLVKQLEVMIDKQNIPSEPKAIDYKNKSKSKFVEDQKRYLETLGWKKQIQKLKKLKENPEAPLTFYDWKLDFPEILNDSISKETGFDIVIGNPPYVSNKSIDDDIKEHFKYSDDLYNYFFLKGSEILKHNGIFCYITSNTFLTLQTKKNIRDLLLNKRLLTLVNLGHDVFESAMVSTAITIFKNTSFSKEDKVKIIDARGKKKLSLAPRYCLNSKEFYGTPENVFFVPNSLNLSIHKKYSKILRDLINEHWNKISTSRNISKNRKLIDNYHKTLKPGNVTLMGLITDGGQGLATGNNGFFVGVLKGTKEADRTEITRFQKIKKFNQEYNTNHDISGLSEFEIRTLFDELKEMHGRDIFGQGYLFRIVSPSELADIDTLSSEEKEKGISGRSSFVPYDKGDKDGNRWYLKTSYYIDWSVNKISDIKARSHKKGKGKALWQNSQFYFREGFCWSDIHTVLIKSRLKGKSVHDVKSMSLFPTSELISAKYLVCIINSTFASEFSFEFLNNTSTLQINDARQLPIIIPDRTQLKAFEDLFDKAYSIQLEKFEKKSSEEAVNEKLVKIQLELDEMINEIYLGKKFKKAKLIDIENAVKTA
ncbi:Eco57I restriction-modification methylase [Salegentibacter salarius]|nr:Eco57I restriction-modification methylase [Salegentibacter salarius]